MKKRASLIFIKSIIAKCGLNGRKSLLTPYLFFALFFIILPLVLVIIKAFTPINGELSNWNIAYSPTTWQIMWRSVWTGFAGGIICILIGFPYTYLLTNAKTQTQKNIGLSLILSPLMVFTISKALAIRGLFSALFDEKYLNNELFMILGVVYLYLPFVIMPLYLVLKDMPKNIVEASQDLGHSKLNTVFKVVVPYSLKAIISGFSAVFLITATSIVISDKMLPNGSQVQLAGNLINNFGNSSNPFDLAKASTLVLITMILLMFIYGLFHIGPYLLNKYYYKGGRDE
ncbi:ABC transporter permease [Mycoplasma phocoenae]|uniref:ABC transporter permease n=1 Tax=Mycoplasma phocoenae TaxID=754517 RepID=A0A858U5T0_9MOLU|nr:ABC transporter permease [Mycoplasma phocoenae]QJG66797.1 ABC transporter permease [Mycoplasma phocoenae]